MGEHDKDRIIVGGKDFDMNPVLLALIDKGLTIVWARAMVRSCEVVIEKDNKLHNLRFIIFCGGCSLKQFAHFYETEPIKEIMKKNWVECLDEWLRPQVDLPGFIK